MSEALLHPPVNELILRLYREAKERPADQFRGWAIAQLQELVGFDSAFWFEGYPSVAVQVHTEYLFNMPEEMMVNYYQSGIAEQDFLLHATLAQLGTTQNTRDLMPREEFLRLPAYQEHCRHYGMEHALSTALVDDQIGLHTFFSVFQSDPERPFTEPERRTKELVAPHMVEAYRTSLFFHLSRLVFSDPQAGAEVALIDQGGVVYQATDRFTGLIRKQWPDWQGPRLPQALLEALPTEQADGFGRLWFRIQRAGADLLLLKVGHRGPLERLSPSERQVATAIANGHSYKEAAREIGVSPSTVTNHMNRIYRKLGISNKAELADLMAREPTPLLVEGAP